MTTDDGKTIADLIQDRFGLSTRAGAETPADGTVAQLLRHRTHRRYKPDPVPDDVLEIALAAALSSPSKSDLQQVAVIVVRDRAVQAEIGSWIPDMPWIATAPLFMVFCGDNRRVRRIAELRGRPWPNDTLDMFMNAAVDAGMALQGFVTAAEALGLGCCPISVVRNHVEKLSERLGLAPSVFPVAGLCVGYPSQAGWISMRLPPSLTVHTDRYDDGNFEAADRRLRPAARGAPRDTAGEPARRRSLRRQRIRTDGRRTRPGSTRCPSATTSAPSSAVTAFCSHSGHRRPPAGSDTPWPIRRISRSSGSSTSGAPGTPRRRRRARASSSTTRRTS